MSLASSSAGSTRTRIGLVEVGSRALRLLIADFDKYGAFKPGKIKSIQHGIDPSELSSEKVLALNSSARSMIESLHDQSCDRILIYGTEICRRIASAFPGMLDASIKVLTPQEEAVASWAAGLLCESDKSRPFRGVVIDEGNGSTEIAVAVWDGKKIDNLEYASIGIGSNELMTMYKTSPVNYLDNLFQMLELSRSSFVNVHKSAKLDGGYLAGGAATKLAWIRVRKDWNEEYQPHRVNGAEIDIPYLSKIFEQLKRIQSENPALAVRFVDARHGSEDELVRALSSAPFLSFLISEVTAGHGLKVTGYGVRHGMSFLACNALV